MLYKRFYSHLGEFLKPRRILILYGPRRAGKTTLLEQFLKESSYRYRLDTGDNIKIQNLLSSGDLTSIIEYAKGYDLIALDEAQQIPNIGMALKMLVDHCPDLQLIATGSSSFDLAQSVGEPLTGRKHTLTLFPFAQLELLENYPPFEVKERLEEFLIFGSYPDVILANGREEKIEVLTELVDSYLLKDILALEKIKSSQTLLNLVKLLAFQVGQLVSLNELATQLHIDVKTVGRYIDLLEKSFIICSLSGFSRNLRKEITSKRKYYFLDNGIRNAVIAQFNPLQLRNDIGELWENFLFSERLKMQTYHRFYGSRYFWRTYEGKEIDLVEEKENELQAFEFKWSDKKKVKLPKIWVENYPNAAFKVINSKNYLDFVS